MKDFEHNLKNELRDRIKGFVDDMCDTGDWEDSGIHIPSEAVSKITDAAWAVFSAIYHAQEFERDYI